MSYKSDLSKAKRIEEAKEFPKVVLIDNCSACNLRCSMCDHQNIRNYRNIETMDRALYEKIIDEVAIENPDARVWQIFFGDPFLCKDMAERIAYAKAKGLTDVVLNTNGLLMDEVRAEKVIKAGLDAIYVGVDAATKETYDKIRVGGDYDTAVKNVINYRKMMDKYGTESQQIFVQFVVSDINENEVDLFKSFWAKHDINVKIRPKISWAGLIDADNLRPNEDVKRKPCYWLMQTMNICSDGEVALCSVDLHCRVKCGNVNKKSLKEIWQGQLHEYRLMHLEERFNELPEMCSKCSDWQSAYAEYFISDEKDSE